MEFYRISSMRQARLPKFEFGSFCRLPVTTAFCDIETEKCRDAGVISNDDDDDDFINGYGQMKEDFTSLTKHDILQP